MNKAEEKMIQAANELTVELIRLQKEVIDAQHENIQLRKKIAEIEESFDDLDRENKLLKDLLRNKSRRSEAHNLEQQAKGLENYVSETMENNYIQHLDINNVYHCLLINLNAKALRLQEQAKQLGGNS